MIKINTRQRLRIFWLLLGMMFFFGIEQLFLNKILKDSAARGYLTIAYVSALIIFDIPTGIIADRISRKLCLVLAAFTQILSIIILGSSNTLAMYLIGSFVFGLCVCLANGAAQALLYDWLALENKTSDYAKEQGRNYAAFLIGAGIANIASGYLANAVGLRGNYYLSVLPCVLALILLIKLVDPPFSKVQNSLWYKHANEVFKEMIKNRKIVIFSIQMTASSVAFYTIGEFGQIYMLAFGISSVALGIFWAIDALFAASGRALAYKIQNYPRLLVLVFCIVIFMFSLIEKRWGIGVFWLFYGLNEALSNVAETEIQNETTSEIRATTLSVVSFVGNIIAIPIIFAYTHYYRNHGIFAANKAVIYILILVLLATLFVKPKTKSKIDATKLVTLPPSI